MTTSESATVRILMWSGPRNLSTAMMRSFGNRADCAVIDEPFYAPFLAATGLDHPMRDDIIEQHETDPEAVAALCAAAPAGGEPLFYQKHLTQHILPDTPLEWTNGARQAFLIREPERVVASYQVKRESPTFDDLGFRQQAMLFDRVAQAHGEAPPVIESVDVLADPEGMLRVLCSSLDIPYDEAMLSWTTGTQPSDGVWARHWYNAVINSTGFSAPLDSPLPTLEPELQRLADEARPYYEELRAHRLSA